MLSQTTTCWMLTLNRLGYNFTSILFCLRSGMLYRTLMFSTSTSLDRLRRPFSLRLVVPVQEPSRIGWTYVQSWQESNSSSKYHLLANSVRVSYYSRLSAWHKKNSMLGGKKWQSRQHESNIIRQLVLLCLMASSHATWMSALLFRIKYLHRYLMNKRKHSKFYLFSACRTIQKTTNLVDSGSIVSYSLLGSTTKRCYWWKEPSSSYSAGTGPI